MKSELFQVIRSQLILDKMCQNKLNYSSEICENLTSYEDIQTEVQKHVTDYEANYRSITFAPKWLWIFKNNKTYVYSLEFSMPY